MDTYVRLNLARVKYAHVKSYWKFFVQLPGYVYTSSCDSERLKSLLCLNKTISTLSQFLIFREISSGYLTKIFLK